VFAWYPPLWTDTNNTDTQAFINLAPHFYSKLSDAHGFIVDYDYYLAHGTQQEIKDSKAEMNASWVKAQTWFSKSNLMPLLQALLQGGGVITQPSQAQGRDWAPHVDASLSFGK